MQAIILAGGRGERLGKLTEKIPKPLIEIGGKPIIRHQIELLADHGITDIWLLLGYGAKHIQDYFGDGSRFGVSISYHIEEAPLGTAGALKAIEQHLTEDFLVLSGDILANMDISRFVRHHHSKLESTVTVIVQPSDHPFESDHVVLGHDDRILGFNIRPHAAESSFRNMSIASGYIFSPTFLSHIPMHQKTDIEKDILPKLVQKGTPLYAYRTPEYLQDIGSPALLQKANDDYQSGKVAALNLKQRMRAVFLDRDGVINEDSEGYITRPEQFSIYNGVSRAIRMLNDAGFLVIITTNQPAIALGLATESDIEEVHKKMDTLLGRENAKVDAVYHCPHRHESRGLTTELPELIGPCECRKPNTGLIEQAVQDLNIDMSRSFLVGDKTDDAKTAENAGLTFVGVATGYGLRDNRFSISKGIHITENLLAAARHIINNTL